MQTNDEDMMNDKDEYEVGVTQTNDDEMINANDKKNDEITFS